MIVGTQRPPPSLCNAFTWTEIIAALGIRLDTYVLPQQISCPIKNCRGRMHLFNDINLRGIWIYCETCNFSGDLVELAMTHWEGLSITETIYKLVSLGCNLPEKYQTPEEISRYLAFHVDKRNNLKTFVDSLNRRLLVDDNKAVRDLQQKLGVRSVLTGDRLLQGPGEFFGVSNRAELEKYFSSAVMSDRIPTCSVDSLTKDATFVGGAANSKRWGESLVFTLHDMPGRVRSLLIVGRDGRIPEDTRLRIIRYGMGAKATTERESERDPGVIMLKSLFKCDSEFASSAVVMNDLFLALRLQVNHLRDYSKPLPLLGLYSGELAASDPHIFSQIKRDYIFWGQPNGELFRHARAARGRVYLSGFTADEVTAAFIRVPPATWIRRAISDAIPWEEALEKCLMSLPSIDAERVLLGMRLTAPEIASFTNNCSDDLKDRLAPFITAKKLNKKVYLDSVPVVEDDEFGWFDTKNGNEISNGILRIDRVVNMPNGKRIYEGRIVFKGQEIAYSAPAETVETDTFTWMAKYVSKAKLGLLSYHHTWKTRAVRLATAFNEPEIVDASISLGWDEERSAFIFRDFIIKADGTVCDNDTYMTAGRINPTIGLVRPTDLSAADITSLSSPTSAGFWAAAAGVTGNLLAPLYGMKTYGVAVVGKEIAAVVTKAAKKLGCSAYEVESYGRDEVAKFTKQLALHRWPLVMRIPVRTRTWLKTLASQLRLNYIVRTHWWRARALALRKRWTLIEAAACADDTISLETAHKLLPTFLQWHAKTGFSLSQLKGGFINKCLKLLAKWFESIGGDIAPLRTANRLIWAGDYRFIQRVVSNFFMLLCECFLRGELTLARGGFMKAKKAFCGLIFLPRAKGEEPEIFIPKAVVNTLLAAHKSLKADTEVITSALESSGILVKVMEIGGLSGWVIKEAIWDQKLAEWQKSHKFKLKIEF